MDDIQKIINYLKEQDENPNIMFVLERLLQRVEELEKTVGIEPGWSKRDATP